MLTMWLTFLPPAWLICLQYLALVVFIVTLPGLQNGKTTRLIRLTFAFPAFTCAVLYFAIAVDGHELNVLQWMVRWEREISWAVTTSSIWLVARHYTYIISEHAKQHDSFVHELVKEVQWRKALEVRLEKCLEDYDESD